MGSMAALYATQPGYMNLGLTGPVTNRAATAQLGQQHIGNLMAAYQNIGAMVEPGGPASQKIQARLAALQQQSAGLGAIAGGLPGSLTSGLTGGLANILSGGFSNSFNALGTQDVYTQQAKQQLQQMATQLTGVISNIEPESPLVQEAMGKLASIQGQIAQLDSSAGMSSMSSGFGNPLGSTLGASAGQNPQVAMAASMATMQALPQKYQGTALGDMHTKLTGQALTGGLGPRMGWLLNTIRGVGQADAKQAAKEDVESRLGEIVELHDDLSTRLSTLDPTSEEGQELIDRLVTLEKTIAAEYTPEADKTIENLVESLKILLDTLDEGSNQFLAVKQRITNLQKIRHASGNTLNGGGSSSDAHKAMFKALLADAVK